MSNWIKFRQVRILFLFSAFIIPPYTPIITLFLSYSRLFEQVEIHCVLSEDMQWHCPNAVFCCFFFFSPLNVAECSRIQGRLDQSITADIRREAACQNDIAYGSIWIVFTYFSCSYSVTSLLLLQNILFQLDL